MDVSTVQPHTETQIMCTIYNIPKLIINSHNYMVVASYVMSSSYLTCHNNNMTTLNVGCFGPIDHYKQ